LVLCISPCDYDVVIYASTISTIYFTFLIILYSSIFTTNHFFEATIQDQDDSCCSKEKKRLGSSYCFATIL